MRSFSLSILFCFPDFKKVRKIAPFTVHHQHAGAGTPVGGGLVADVDDIDAIVDAACTCCTCTSLLSDGQSALIESAFALRLSQRCNFVVKTLHFTVQCRLDILKFRHLPCIFSAASLY